MRKIAGRVPSHYGLNLSMNRNICYFDHCGHWDIPREMKWVSCPPYGEGVGCELNMNDLTFYHIE